MMRPKMITKELSANDTGETGGHQAGILVPRRPELLGFFPPLNVKKYNPRVHLHFTDSSGGRWEFAFIYYNNRFFGGTRNEYRLTRMTKYIRSSGLMAGDVVELSRDDEDEYRVDFQRKNRATVNEKGALSLGSGWRVINVK